MNVAIIVGIGIVIWLGIKIEEIDKEIRSWDDSIELNLNDAKYGAAELCKEGRIRSLEAKRRARKVLWIVLGLTFLIAYIEHG
tara:strand:- start:422 stop:670 length:249 start_codon:yes stop_codon:yes gene_type:complete